MTSHARLFGRQNPRTSAPGCARWARRRALKRARSPVGHALAQFVQFRLRNILQRLPSNSAGRPNGMPLRRCWCNAAQVRIAQVSWEWRTTAFAAAGSMAVVPAGSVTATADATNVKDQ